MKALQTIGIAAVAFAAISLLGCTTQATKVPDGVFTTPKTWQVKIPDSKNSLTLSEAVSYQNIHYLKGEVAQDGDQNTTLVNVSQGVEQSPYWITTSVWTNSGSGAFYYLSLFKYENHKMVNIDNRLIGDRIQPKSLQFTGENVGKLSFLSHTQGQTYALPPTELHTWSFSIQNNHLKIQNAL